MFEHIKFALLVLAIAAGLSVRPVHASGSVSAGYTYHATAGYTSPAEGSAVAACDYVVNLYATANPTWNITRGACTEPPSTTQAGSFTVLAGGSVYQSGTTTKANATSCPANSTGTVPACTCTDPYVPDASGTFCVMPACPATGTLVSAGFYDLGTVDNPNNHPPLVGCDAGCSTAYSGGGQAYRQLVGGVYHYYALGSYTNDDSINNGACTTGSPSPSSVGTSLPPQSCGANQGHVSDSNGNLTCIDNGTGAPVSPISTDQQSANSSSSAADASAAGSAAATAAGAAATAAGADPATAQAAAQSAAAQAAANQAAKDSFCTSHPDSLSCMSAGTPPAADAVPAVTVTASATPVSFTSAAGCPAPLPYSIFGTQYNISFQPACDFFTTIKPIVLTIAAATAAIIMMGVF